MKLSEFANAWKMLEDAWPRTYTLILGSERFANPTLSAFMYQRIGDRVAFDDWKAGVDSILAGGGGHDPSDIIRAINDVINKRARSSAAERKEPCEYCLDTGFVEARDKDGYDYAFRCPKFCKEISNKIPMWGPDYETAGFKRIVVNGQLTI